MRRSHAIAAILATCISGQAMAADVRAAAGQPFCQTMEDMQPYLIALLQKNMAEAARYDCGGMPAGTRLTILREMPSDSEVGHIAMVRAFFLGGGGGLTGYTLILAK